jgi:serine/threonine protein kinase
MGKLCSASQAWSTVYTVPLSHFTGMHAVTAPSVLSGAEILEHAEALSQLGSGSNGVVLLVSRPPAHEASRVPEKYALKVMSHFWDSKAVALLDCERTTLRYLPPHPNIIHVYASFAAAIPPAMHRLLTPNMQAAATADPHHSTQMFALELHPCTLDAYRLFFPLPLPWFIIWRLARDLVDVCTHLDAHRVLHADLKADNILVAVDGRPVLTDFGISRVFSEDDGFSMPFCEPFPLLMNRLVLAPEVLQAHDAGARAGRKRRAIAAGTQIEDAGIRVPFARQGIWSVGVVLYELACWYSHEPSYPDDGGGVCSLSYSLATLPPVPEARCGPPESGSPALAPSATSPPTCIRSASEKGSFFQGAAGSALHYFSAQGYPSAFANLVLAMLDADPSSRISSRDALLVLEAMAPVYVCAPPDPSMEEGAAPELLLHLPDGCSLRVSASISVLRDGGSIAPKRSPASCSAGEFPVLLRHACGDCRLILCQGGGVSVEDMLKSWDSAARCVFSHGDFGLRSSQNVLNATVLSCRVLLGASEVDLSEQVQVLRDRVDSLAVAPPRTSTFRVLVLDLVPKYAYEEAANALIRELDDMNALCARTGAVHIDRASRFFQSDLPAGSSQGDRMPAVLRWLRTRGAVENFVAIDAADSKRISPHLPPVDMREALIYRCCLALTGLCNSALRGEFHCTIALVSCMRSIDSLYSPPLFSNLFLRCVALPVR